MNTGDLSSPPGRLHDAWQKLELRWQGMEREWHDQVSRDFEEQYLAELAPEIARGIERMRDLAAFFQTAIKECEE